MMNVLLALAAGLVFGYYYGKVIDTLTMEGLERIKEEKEKM